LEPDGLVPSGTFVEFSWHSFETDGDLDGFPYSTDSTAYYGASGDGGSDGSGGETEAASDNREE
jgi:hypothetical protein